MSELRRVGAIACVLLVALRIAIGWQFVYEGLWKLDTQDKKRPWTAVGYLKNAQGPFRNYFRNLTGDPDDRYWLDDEQVAARWDDWQQRFVAHYGLDADQQKKLAEMLNGLPTFNAILEKLPAGVELPEGLSKVVRFDPKRKRLIVDGKLHLLQRERDELLRLVSKNDRSGETNAFRKAVNDVYARSTRLANANQSGVAFKERLTASLKGDPQRGGVVYTNRQGDVVEKRLGEIELYRTQAARYEEALGKVQQRFQQTHLMQLSLPGYGSPREMRARVLGSARGVITTLEDELQQEAAKLLTREQQARGELKTPRTKMDVINSMTMLALVTLGGLLMTGLFSRVAAVAAAGLLLSFYLVMPPWPGVVDFQELAGPEHSFIIDKNMIEVIALLAIAAVPTGTWFGLDGLLWRLVRRRSQVGTTPAAATQTLSTETKPTTTAMQSKSAKGDTDPLTQTEQTAPTSS